MLWCHEMAQCAVRGGLEMTREIETYREVEISAVAIQGEAHRGIEQFSCSSQFTYGGSIHYANSAIAARRLVDELLSSSVRAGDIITA